MAAKGIDRASAEKFLQRFEKIMSSTPPEELPKKIASFGRPEDIAERLSQLSADASTAATATPGTAASAAPKAAEKPSAAVSQPGGTGNTAGQSAGAVDPRREGGRAPARNAQPARTGERSATAKPGSAVPTQKEQAGGRRPEGARQGAPSRASREEGRAAGERQALSQKGERAFWWTVVLTSPIWGFLLCAVMAAFLLAYTAIFFVAAVLIIAEVVLIVGGVLLAVIGIVYGIMQMLPGAEAAYIGLYELGLGIRIGGFTMLFSIIVYNIVVNLTPLALKQLTRFMKFTARGIGSLVGRIRKEFGKL